MIRLFLPPEALTSKEISITGNDARHLALVLRADAGDPVTILDGRGFSYECRLITIHKKEVRAEIIAKAPYSAESPVSITLAQGLPKGSKMDFIIQKATELGVNRIIPLITERSQVRSTEKADRWRKIAHSASQQSARERIPEIEEPVDFNEFINNNSLPSPPLSKEVKGGFTQAGIILSEDEKEMNLKKILSCFQGTTGITLLIGSEGGFSKDEVSTAIQKGFVSASLGPRILRTETAPISAISIIQYELGDIG
jgi:16S rRNA (uracil1498-N3)-methyltransferase